MCGSFMYTMNILCLPGQQGFLKNSDNSAVVVATHRRSFGKTVERGGSCRSIAAVIPVFSETKLKVMDLE